MLKTGILIGSFFALTTVALGAFGAHALKDQLSLYGKSIYEKGILYQMFHALSILILSLIHHLINNLDLSICIWIFALGIMIFSGSLYILALTEIKWFGAITPIGGMLFIVGWIILFYKTLNFTF